MSQTQDEHRGWYASCCTCGARWKLATIPAPMSVVIRALARAMCPNCGDCKNVNLCQTSGDGAVSRVRKGKVVV